MLGCLRVDSHSDDIDAINGVDVGKVGVMSANDRDAVTCLHGRSRCLSHPRVNQDVVVTTHDDVGAHRGTLSVGSGHQCSKWSDGSSVDATLKHAHWGQSVGARLRRTVSAVASPWALCMVC